MAYTDVVSLAEAKQFLRLDSGFTADDDLITLIIGAAGEYIELVTNHILFSRSKEYPVIGGEIRIYDHPITAVTDPSSADDYEVTEYRTYNVYELSEDSITITVGYGTDAFPSALKIEMLNMIDNLYHGNDGDNEESKIYQRISKFKRFII